MTNTALSNLRIIDLSQYIAGPYCTKLMSGFGAEVIKVERPKTGDRMRTLGPFYKNESDIERSIPFLWLNTGKKSVTLDLETDKGMEIIKGLVSDADVIIESFSPGVMKKLGLNYEALRAINPRLVMTSISNFGQTGPYKNYEAEEIQLNAMSGTMYLTGDPSKPPLNPGPSISQYTAGQHAYIATLMALFERDFSGEGQFVDLSMQESGVEHIEISLTYNLQMGLNKKRGGHMFVPWNTYECQDGYANIIAMPYRHWHRAAELFKDIGLFDKKYDHLRERIDNRSEYEAMLKPCIKVHKGKDLFQEGQSRKLAFGYVAGLDEVIESPQHRDRGFFVEIDHPAVGKHRYCGAPFKMSRTPWRTSRAPLLGEHNEEIFAGIDGSPDNGKEGSKSQGNMKESASLKGLRVIDFSHSWAAPHCARIFADFGAEVIKVEYVRRLCLLRGGRKEDRSYDKHPGWLQVNRNKLAITLDLDIEKDREAFRDLIKTSDVIIENSRTGVMENLGFGYDELIKIKKDLMVLSMSAFGNTGPYSSYAGYGAVFEAVGGIQSLTAYEKSGKPTRIKELDITNGLVGACAVMTALLYRQKTGEGQHIDLSQLEGATHTLIGEHLLEYIMNGTRSLPIGNRHRIYAPQGCYRCKGDDKWVTITVRSEKEWQNFCHILEHPEWISDPRFVTAEERMQNHDVLDSMIGEWTINHTHYYVMNIMQGSGIPSGAVLSTEEIVSNGHLKDRDYFIHEEGDSGGLFMGMPFKLSGGAGRIQWHGPALGKHNEYVLCGLLGRSKEEAKPVHYDDIRTAFDPE
jgi:crotonobetainyl-CoA:carnitine CoA-transferase CaiB-like acyl-CoA transferase